MSSRLAESLALLPRASARRVASASPAPLSWIRTHSGEESPALTAGNRPATFHSRYNPVAEAQRMSASVAKTDTVICLGLGAGLHVPALAAAARFLLIVEWDASVTRAVLEHADLRGALSLCNVSVLVAPSSEELAEHLAQHYVAALHGSPLIVSLQGQCAADPEGIGRTRRTVSDAVEILKDDLAVQARLGRAWVRNALMNLGRVLPPWAPLTFAGRSVLIAAAGPSLEDHLTILRHRGSRYALIATDTAAPTVVSAGIRPDLVLSIDCQPASVHHVLPEAVRSLPFLVDLSAPPSLVDAVRHVGFYLSSHPLARYLAAAGLGYPSLDTGAGNVTHVAALLAASRGAAEIIVVGADFAYPGGRTYARGSYVDRLFHARATRFRGAASAHFRFLHERPGLTANSGSAAGYAQALLTAYGHRFATMAHRCAVPVSAARTRSPGIGLPPWDYGASPPAASGTPPETHTTGTTRSRGGYAGEIAGALEQVKAELRAVPENPLMRPDVSYRAGMAILAPLLTWMRSRDAKATTGELLRHGRRECEQLVDRALRSIANSGVTNE
jgi:hypothetical protein